MEQLVDLQLTLETLKKQVLEEKNKLDYILKGAQLLAEMLVAAEAKSGNQTGTEIQRSEPGLEEAAGTGKRESI